MTPELFINNVTADKREATSVLARSYGNLMKV